jgi:hypothetical protein
LNREENHSQPVRRLLFCTGEDFGLSALRIASLGNRACLRALRSGDRSWRDAKGAQHCRIAVRVPRIRSCLDRSPRSGAAKRFARPPAACRGRVAVLPWIDRYPRGGLHDRERHCSLRSAFKSSLFPQLSPSLRPLSLTPLAKGRCAQLFGVDHSPGISSLGEQLTKVRTGKLDRGSQFDLSPVRGIPGGPFMALEDVGSVVAVSQCSERVPKANLGSKLTLQLSQ